MTGGRLSIRPIAMVRKIAKKNGRRMTRVMSREPMATATQRPIFSEV